MVQRYCDICYSQKNVTRHKIVTQPYYATWMETGLDLCDKCLEKLKDLQKETEKEYLYVKAIPD